ncbi:MAG: DUF47 family protein [Chthoniobacteraceae bacterium]|nr:DUF47 family protein [Chthoniobacteraceae bacterium]
MNPLKRLFGRDDKFYDLLEASANEAQNSAKILSALMPKLGDERAVHEALELLAQSRRKHKRITQDITNSLCRTFVTPLEREDIEALSNALSRVPKTMEKIGERLLICPLNAHAANMVKHVAMLEQAAATVNVMVKALRTNPHVEEIEDEYAQLQTLEGDADRFMIALLRELFHGQADAKDALFLKDMYELLEKAIDRCRDAGNVVFQVVLKYS